MNEEKVRKFVIAFLLIIYLCVVGVIVSASYYTIASLVNSANNIKELNHANKSN